MIIDRFERSCRVMLQAALFALLPLALAQPSLAELQREVRQQPGNPEAWVNLGNAYLAAERFEDAKESFLEAVSVEYRNGDAHFGLGLAEYGRGDYQAALFAFNEVARLYPERFDGHYNQAVTLAQLRRPDEAAAAFRRAIARAEPEATAEDLVNAHLGLAGQLKRSGKYAEAADAYGQALEVEPERTELAYLRAEALYRAGRGLDALPALTELEASGTDYRVSVLIASIYVEQGQIDYALRSLQRSLRQAEEAGEAEAQAGLYLELGLLQRQLGRDAQAITSFQRAATADPASWEARYNLGVSYLETGQAQDAVVPLEEAATLAPESGEARLALASAYDQLGRTQDAAREARGALQRLADAELAAEARFVLGRAQYRLADYAGAAQTLAQVIQERPSDAQAQLWAGLAEYQLGNYRTAAQYYERAVQLAPDSTEARVNLAAAYLAAERFQDAAQVYEQLAGLNPQDAESRYNLGWALLSLGRRTEARAAWEQASGLGFQPAADALRSHF